MVEAMGGAESELYRAFCAHACEAYNILRKSASLILSLFHLMAGAAIPDIRSDPEKAMLKLQARTLQTEPLSSIGFSLQSYDTSKATRGCIQDHSSGA
jgi:phosphatidylinositol kinase/protein kinase (PI-3  family)